MFSITTMVASTIMPIPMARPPRDMRLALMPNCSIRMNVRRIENGSDSATITEDRRLPRNTASTITTSMRPCQSAVVTVLVARATKPACS